MIDASLLRDAAEMLREGLGPDISAGADDTYADWLEDVADRFESGALS